MRIAGIRIPLMENMEKNMERIPAFWKQTMESPKFREICALADREPRNILGVSTYRDPQNIFYIYCGPDRRAGTGRYAGLHNPRCHMGGV